MVGRQLPGLHGDGLVKLQGCAHELSHLAVITAQFAIGLAVGEVKVFQAGKFDLEFLDLFEGEMRVAGVGFAPESLADEKREVAAVRGHGTVQDLAGQAVAKLAARDHAFRVAAGMGAPRDEGSVLLPRGAIISAGSRPVDRHAHRQLGRGDGATARSHRHPGLARPVVAGRYPARSFLVARAEAFLPTGGVVLNEKNPGAPFEEAVVTFHRHPVVKDTSYRTRQVSRY